MTLQSAMYLLGDAGAKISVQYECSKPESPVSTLTTIYLMQAPVLLRLVFHDAATYDVSAGNGGINASIQYEFGRPENTGLKRGWYESPACAVLCPHCMSTQGVLFTWLVPRRPSNCLPWSGWKSIDGICPDEDFPALRFLSACLH